MDDGTFNFDSVREALNREIENSGKKPTNVALAISPNNKSLLNNILSGKDIKLSTLTKLAEQLEVNVARLIPWARPEPMSVSSEALRGMLEATMRELPVGATVEDYLRSVPEGLRERLERHLADAGSPGSSDEESAHDTTARSPSPTKPDAGA